jgi:aldehyde dehydrogenase (NAD+)
MQNTIVLHFLFALIYIMDLKAIQQSFNRKRIFFDEGHTQALSFRLEQLKKLKSKIKANEKNLIEALKKDFHKPEFETYSSELALVYEEIDFFEKNLSDLMDKQYAGSPLLMWPSRSYTIASARGVCCIIAPWNYPFQLAIVPLVGAIASGNCVILKPSDQTKHCAELIEKIIKECFSEDYVSTILGAGSEVMPLLLENNIFNHIFFTGSPNVGKQIMAYATQHLIPVTLELGGKSPCIVHSDANLKVTAKRIVWSKFFNGGQTCIGIDYLIVHEKIKDQLVQLLIQEIKNSFGTDAAKSESFAHIINLKRFITLKNYLSDGHIVYGGKHDESQLFIEPTLMDGVDFDKKVMQEEIFGPVLPILTYKDKPEAVALVRKNRYPLATYIYTKSDAVIDYFQANIEFGGGCINAGLFHLANLELPFGGVMQSGVGRYHGKYSFETFSHIKSMVHHSTWIDPFIKYAPYNKLKLRIIKWIMG